MNSELISKQVIDGTEYFTTVKSGVEYCGYFCKSVGQWFVSTRRLALGRHNSGGGKYFNKIDDCKAFAALPALISMGAL